MDTAPQFQLQPMTHAELRAELDEIISQMSALATRMVTLESRVASVEPVVASVPALALRVSQVEAAFIKWSRTESEILADLRANREAHDVEMVVMKALSSAVAEMNAMLRTCRLCTPGGEPLEP